MGLKLGPSSAFFITHLFTEIEFCFLSFVDFWNQKLVFLHLKKVTFPLAMRRCEDALSLVIIHLHHNIVLSLFLFMQSSYFFVFSVSLIVWVRSDTFTKSSDFLVTKIHQLDLRCPFRNFQMLKYFTKKKTYYFQTPIFSEIWVRKPCFDPLMAHFYNLLRWVTCDLF